MKKFTVKKEPFARYFLECDSDSLELRTACGLLGVAKEMDIMIDTFTGFPNAMFNGMNVNYFFSGGVTCYADGLRMLAEEDKDHADEYLYMLDNIQPYNMDIVVRDSFTKEEKDLTKCHAMWAGTWVGHAVPDLIDIARYGTDSIREKISKYRKINPDKKDFYDAIAKTMDAFDTLGQRFYTIACGMLKNAEGQEAERLEKAKKTFEVCPKKPAFDFFSACSVYVMAFTFDGIDSPGHFDQYMIDFYRKTDKAERMEILEKIWMFFHSTRTWNLCIGGSDENWNDLTNELTYDILDVAQKYKYQTPNITMRCHRNSPPELLKKAAETIASGIGMPVLYNDEVVCPALEELGIPPEDSHLYVMNGCNQIDIQGKSHMGLEDGEVCIAKALEFALHDGFCPINNKQISIKTGNAREFKTYEELYSAFIKQLDYLTETAANLSNKAQKIMAEKSPQPIRSATIEGCIEKGIDYKNGGPLYGHGQILAEGIADAADSLAAIKKYVFEDKKTDMKTLIDALDTNFEGYDELYYLLKNSELKFGNDIDYVDNIASEIVEHFFRKLNTIKTYRGGIFGGGCSTYDRAASYGKDIAAMPNGKKNGESIFADSISAVPGYDTHGPTATIKSCLKYNQKLAKSGFVLNIKFDKELFASEKGQQGFLDLAKTYFSNGGQQMSVNVLSKEELIDAQKNPGDHQNLVVRVGGYSDYFVWLSKELQDNIIARTSFGV